jgi:PPK2 family polyphosphate:nucleotide phosphotransferase
MDASGKDGVIRNVLAAVDPQGCEVHSFGAPSSEELDHDFIWRHARLAPRRGHIGVFNRSYYEEVLVVRVHPELLAAQRTPSRLARGDVWAERFESIRDHERHLGRSGTAVLKFFLNVSPEEQRHRFLERLAESRKNWKFNPRDVRERKHWASYQQAYEEAIRNTATREAPWFVVPADSKWYTRLVVGAAIADTLLGLELAYPSLGAERGAAMASAREELLEEADGR